MPATYKPAAQRSQFIAKLFETLQQAENPQDLSWASVDTFRVTVDDVRARRALAGNWDFRSLSSFIRQLSYYGFKRLSDRRRSVERRTGVASSFIVFAHPSGNFVQNDPSKLGLIVRKLRARKTGATGTRRARKNSSDSSEMHEEDRERDNDEEESKPSVFRPIEQYTDANPSWAPALPQGGRQKPNLSIELDHHNSVAGGPLDWQSRASPYPTPLLAASPGFHSSYYPQTSYFSYPPQLPPLGHNFPPSHELGPVRPHGAVIAPPSPTDSHSYSSSPKNSPPEELVYYRSQPVYAHGSGRRLSHGGGDGDDAQDPHRDAREEPYYPSSNGPYANYRSPIPLPLPLPIAILEASN